MAQDNRSQQQQAPAPTRQQSQVPADSPYYTKDTMPDDCSPAARWLLVKGWKCLGHPNWESAGWLPPGAVLSETSTREAKYGHIRRVTGREPNGNPIVTHVREQLKEQDGADPNNMGQPTVPVTQLVVTMPAQPVGFRQAVEIQQAREEKARRDAAKAKDEQAVNAA